MNVIKGLLTKDLLQLRSYRKTLIIFIIIFIFTGISQETTKGIGVMVSVMLTFGFGMFSMATFNYDEQSKADRYVLTLPLTKKEVVLSKYVFVISATIIGSIVGILASFLILFIINHQFASIQDVLSTAIGGILGIGLIESIQIPCVYKWGAEKGRIQMFIVAAIILLLIGGIFFVGQKSNINLPVNDVLNNIINFLQIILLLATIIIYYISYRISCRIYKNKEE